MINPVFKFMDKVSIVNDSFYEGAMGQIIGFDRAYGEYTVKLADGIVKLFTEYNLKKVTTKKKAVKK